MVQGLVRQSAYDGEGELHITNDGTLWYQTGMRAYDVDPVWVTRTGVESPVRANWGGRFGPLAISPDGRRVAYSVEEEGRSRLWIAPLDGSGSPTLFEREGSFNDRPSWTPDGRAVAWVSNRSGNNEILMRSVDGQETARRIVGSEPAALWEVSFPRAGPWMLYRAEVNSSDIFALRPGIDSVARAVVSSKAIERQPALSPDGRWLAYSTNEDGRANIYVRPFPDTDAAVWQVTTDGGMSPRWSPDGRELFYTKTTSFMISTADGQALTMMAVPIRAGESFAWGAAQELFSMQGYRAAANSWVWDVSPRDGRFLMLRRRKETALPKLIMVENFFTELRAKVPN
jgi:serine/threonine-protein kinase